MTLCFVDAIDSAGKDTVIQNFTSRLDDISYLYKVIHFPNGASPIGKAIYEVLKDPVEYAYILSKKFPLPLMFEADRLSMSDKLEQGKHSKQILIANRYWPSGLAYAKAQGLAGKQLEILERIVALYPKADFGFILDTPISVAQARLSDRGGSGDAFESNLPLQVRVRQELLVLARKHKYFVLNGTLSPETLGKTIFDTVLDL
jgi:thymidylate kinase